VIQGAGKSSLRLPRPEGRRRRTEGRGENRKRKPEKPVESGGRFARTAGKRGTRHYVAVVSARPVFFRWKFCFSAAFEPRVVKDSGCEKIAAYQPMNRYLLPCSCSRCIVVAAGQAGDTVRCPDCGAVHAVPRLGELGRLEAAGTEPVAESGRGWDALQACVLAGAVTALVGAALAGSLRGCRAGIAPLDEQAVRRAVSDAPADQVHDSWLLFERKGIVRPPVGEEERRIRQAEALGTLEMAAWVAAVAGCLAAGVALAAARSTTRSGGPA
jgi:hypothetical protein